MPHRTKKIYLSFDIEEFDAPTEYGVAVPFDEQLAISTKGTLAILDLLDEQGVNATLFCTANFAQNRPEIIKRIVESGHELASHSYYHSDFTPSHLAESREKLMEISGMEVVGYRSPRMGKVDSDELTKAGYRYDSSVNPCWLPGRYNNLNKPRSAYKTGKLLEIPSSVSSIFRIPLFWLSFHVMPMWLYKIMANGALRKDGYLNIYFHPWEFTEECSMSQFKMPFYIKRNSGNALKLRLTKLITHFKARDCHFETLSALATDKMSE